MIVLSLENFPEKIRGECTKYLMEIKYGLYVGNVSSLVKELLWETIKKNNVGEAVMLCSTNNEQGLSIETIGNPSRFVQDFDGIKLFTYKSENIKDTKTVFRLQKTDK